MAKQRLSAEQKRLETDIWIIALVTFGVFLCYAAMGSRMRDLTMPSFVRRLTEGILQKRNGWIMAPSPVR